MRAKPMDPERLALTRAIIMIDGSRPDVALLRDLLAAHDYHAQRADESRKDAAVAAVRCLEHFDNATSLVIEIARLRARVTVIASDVAGIDPSQVIGYMIASGWRRDRVVPRDGEPRWSVMLGASIGTGTHSGVDVPMMSEWRDYHTVIARIVNDLAKIEGRPGLDIVDAIRATEATP